MVMSMSGFIAIIVIIVVVVVVNVIINVIIINPTTTRHSYISTADHFVLLIKYFDQSLTIYCFFQLVN